MCDPNANPAKIPHVAY